MTREFTYKSSFYWRTSLTDERIEQIMEWVKSLTDEQYKMLKDLVDDQRESAEWNMTNDD